jgi:hypothetical protein
VIGLIVTAVFFPAVGTAVSRLTGRVQPYLAGAGAVGVGLFVLNLAHVPFLAALALIVAGTLAALWHVKPRIDKPHELLPTAIIAIVSAWLLFVTAIVPLDDYDGRAFWLLKARAIAHERQVGGPFFQQRESASPRNQYPLLVPIDAAVLMLAGQELDDRHVRWLYACFAIAFALEVRHKLGAWFGAALLCLPEIFRAAETASSDVALGAFVAAAFFTIVEASSPMQFGLWLSCAVLTKSEGLPLALLLLVAGAFSFRKHVAIAAAPFAVATAALLLWRKEILRSDEAPFMRLVFDWAQHLAHLRKVLAAFGEQAFAFRNWGGLWIAFIAAVAVLAIYRKWRDVALTAGVIVPMIALYATVIAVTDFDLTQMDGLARRLLTHLLGPALYAIAAAISVQAPAPRQVIGERQHEEHAEP